MKINRAGSAILILFFLGLAVCAWAEEEEPDLRAIIERLFEAGKKVESLTATGKLTAVAKEQVQQGEIEIAFKAPDKHRVVQDISGPTWKYAALSISDGKTWWLASGFPADPDVPFEPTEVIRVDLTKASGPEGGGGEKVGPWHYILFPEMLRLGEGAYDYVLLGKELRESVEVYVIEAKLKPDLEDNSVVAMLGTWFKVWVGASDGIIRRVESTETLGRDRSAIEYTDISLNAPVADAKFSYSPPEGAQIIDK